MYTKWLYIKLSIRLARDVYRILRECNMRPGDTLSLTYKVDLNGANCGSQTPNQ